MRFSILNLLGLVAFAAIGSAALLNANSIWISVIFSVTSVVLLTGVLAATYFERERRAFYVGFSLFGFSYFLWITMKDHIADELLTSSLLYIVASVAFPNRGSIDERFFQIGHLLLSLIVGFAGGVIARYFYSLRQKQNAQAAGITSHSSDGERGT